MHRRTACFLVLLMLTSSLSATFVSKRQSDSFSEDLIANSQDLLGSPSNDENSLSSLAAPRFPNPGNPWIEDSLLQRIEFGQEEVRVTVITWSLAALAAWQEHVGAVEIQAPAGAGETLVSGDPTSGEIDHRTFWMDSELFIKLPAVPGIVSILDAENQPAPYDTIPFDSDFPSGESGHSSGGSGHSSDDSGTSSGADSPSAESVRSGEIHGANDAWERGYSGEGLIVAVADTGVDFAHPDLNGTQARTHDTRSPWAGWPMMFDHRSLYYWQTQGKAYPEISTWYADTSTLDYDNDSNGVLDESGYNITGISPSKSGVYHLGEHPDSTLRSKAGGDVPILVVDSDVSGVYESVYVDMDRDGNFTGEKEIKPGSETTGLDTDGDGLWDRSGGLVYWISDGTNGLPYGQTYADRHGYSNRIPGSGNLTLFMLDGGSHGTLCASAVAAQGVVADGKVLGMAPNATIASIGNHYAGGHGLDAWRWIAEGNDGKKTTRYDQPNIGSFSFGYSSIDDSGADGYSLYLDWLTRIYNPESSYAVAIGNGGHGFGTTKVPGAAHGIFSVGAFSSRSSDSWGQSAPWSNRGPNVVGRMDPDIVSVGWSATGDYPLNLRNNANSAYSTWGGTSLATPIAAGLLAIVAEAWLENNGYHPDSQILRDFVLSTADDRGYEPFLQGGGWLNASRAVATLEGDNGTWWASPAQWNSGTFQGQHRDANINYMLPGDSQTVDIEFSNTAESDVLLALTPTDFEPLLHNNRTWLSKGNGSSGENDSWDGYQGTRPDLLIPLHVPNTTFELPPETRQLRARATIDYEYFDGDMDRSSDERVFLQIYRWEDKDDDGIWVEDFDNDSMVDSDDWTESSEFGEVTYWWSNGPNAEVRVGNPFEDARDGLFLGVWNRYSEDSEEPVRIEIDWTAFGTGSDEWISAPSLVTIDANSTEIVQFDIDVPLDAERGLHQHGIMIETYHVNESGIPSIQPHRNWTFPIVTNVPWQGPFEITPRPLDGNVSNQTLYDEEWISGATRWNWRAESGDWRFLTIDWPSEWDTGGTVVIDVDWDDNPYTDIDVLWLDESPHGYAEDSPEAYGDSTFSITKRSVNNHRGSGRHAWGTYTGSSHESFTVPASQGIHQMVLHTALHGVNTNDNPLNISLGYVAAEENGFQNYVDDWANGDGVDAVHVVSTIPMEIEDVVAYGWTQPINLDNETAYQDVASDKMTASWWREFNLTDISELNLKMDAYEAVDLDLFLFYDEDGDGEFESSEEIDRSFTGSSSESIDVENPEDGHYAVAVHGYSVDSGSVQFWIDIDMVGGSELNLTDQFSLTQSEITAIWPNGSQTLAGEMPAAAIQVNLAYERPVAAGTWKGHVEISLEGGVELKMPYTYVLAEVEPIVEFVLPENLTQTNQVLPIELYAIDTGIGFALDDLNWVGIDNLTTIPDADLVEAIDTDLNHHNLTTIWNSGNHFAMPENLSFREVWINASLPEDEQWHEYRVNLTDRAGLMAEDWLSVKFDTTAPILIVSGVPEITNQKELTYTIQTESDARIFRTTYNPTGVTNELIHDGSGLFTHTVNLSQSTYIRDYWHGEYYRLIPGNENVFSISTVDPAGNTIELNFEVIFDSIIGQNWNLTRIQESPIPSFGIELTEGFDIDGDGLGEEADWDDDGDGIADVADPDDDNDGIPDEIDDEITPLDGVHRPITPLSRLSTGFNITEAYMWFTMPVDLARYCLEIRNDASSLTHRNCGNVQSGFFTVSHFNPDDDWITDDDMPPFGWENYGIQKYINFSNYSDGEYLMTMEIWDWANNSVSKSWDLNLDRTIPEIDWNLAPSANENLFEHRLALSWSANENVDLLFTHNGEILEEWNGTFGDMNFELNQTGVHEFCIEAWDVTRGQYNENLFYECRIYDLNASIYQTSLNAPWSGGMTTSDTVQAVARRGPVQELWWYRVGEEESRHLVAPGEEYVALDFELYEGVNEFVVEIHALDKIDEYSVSMIRDTIAPILSFREVSNRTSPLSTTKVVEGECESGVHVTIRSELTTRSFLCAPSGEFSLELDVPNIPGMHLISGTTSDAVNNQNSYSIEILQQKWVDWAVDDVKNQGPMLWYLLVAIGVLILLASMPAAAKSIIRRRRYHKDVAQIENSLDELSDLLNDPSDAQGAESGIVIKPLDWDKVNEEDMPEMEELRAWKSRNKSIYSMADDDEDNDAIEMD